MPVFDNRPGSGTGGGGGGVSNPTLDQAKSDWRVENRSLTALELANGFITLAAQPQDTKVMVKLMHGPVFDPANDIVVTPALSRVAFQADTLNLMLDNFNTHGEVKVQVSYFSITV